MGIFGWSYPAGCSGPPDDGYDDREPWQELFRCKCGAFLPKKAEREEAWEEKHKCPGNPASDGLGFCGPRDADPHKPHTVTMDAGTDLFFTCKRCGKESKQGER